MATAHILIDDGRFWGEADIRARVASTASVVNDPEPTSVAATCCDAQRTPAGTAEGEAGNRRDFLRPNSITYTVVR